MLFIKKAKKHTTVVCTWLDIRCDFAAWFRHDWSRSLGPCGTEHIETNARPPRLAACRQPYPEKVHAPSVLAGEVRGYYFTAVSLQLCAGIDSAHLDEHHALRSCPLERHTCALTI